MHPRVCTEGNGENQRSKDLYCFSGIRKGLIREIKLKSSDGHNSMALSYAYNGNYFSVLVVKYRVS